LNFLLNLPSPLTVIPSEERNLSASYLLTLPLPLPYAVILETMPRFAHMVCAADRVRVSSLSTGRDVLRPRDARKSLLPCGARKTFVAMKDLRRRTPTPGIFFCI
jgi:hypothetical protein